ncbi:T9SS type B sorting domain-containing protein [Dyadobacter bucti]|uniref:T9SS type B sorting domain-containing protein n=1 Tax=Dyadobacter bucti TaxID=2572203 RepID=UPI001109542F|nr:gliding motility-associated C-terminal domain-containing protein [Dyadobacter bucti]
MLSFLKCLFYNILYTIILFSSHTCLAQVNLTDGLIGCYPFSGNANDLSIKANHGDIHGATQVADRFGISNAAYRFDGIDDFIEIKAEPLQLNNFTYSIWVRPHVLPAYGQALFFFSVGSDYGDQHILFGDHYSNDRHTGLSHGSYLGVANNILCTEPSVPPIDVWYHLVLIKTDTDYHLYVNNKIVCSNNVNGGKAFYGTSVVRAIIGARNNYGQASNATIDDIHIYDRAINVKEVEALYTGTAPEEPAAGNIVADVPRICAGDQVTFKLSPNVQDAKFKWLINNVVIAGFETNELFFETSEGSDYSMNVTAEVSFEESCFPKNEFLIKNEFKVFDCTKPTSEPKQLFVPNIFTPNNDGRNDTWEIINASEYKNFEVRVYNRWGEVVFYSKEYSHPWNGIYRGALVPSGVYTFKITSDRQLTKTGTITIIY